MSKPPIFREGHKKEINLLSDDPDPPKILGRDNATLIQKTRCLKGYSQNDLAKKINIQTNIYKDYEKSDTIPNKKILNNICKILNIKINFK